MADTLTESFCERCGTRYEFKAPTRLNPLRKTRGMVGGLKNYLTSQDSFSDSLNDSMRTEQGALASAQLEAFHESFNFCIDCRQYTCLNCWNDDAGRCRTCLPMAGVDDVPDSMPAAPVIGATEVLATDAVQASIGLEAWPTTDLPSAPAPDQAQRVEAWPAAEVLAASNAMAAPADGVLADDGFVYDTPRIELDEPEPVVAEVEQEPEPVVAEVEVEAELVAEVEPEPVVAEVEVEPEPEPVVAEVEPEPVVAEVEPEPVVAEVEPEPGWLPRSSPSPSWPRSSPSPNWWLPSDRLSGSCPGSPTAPTTSRSPPSLPRSSPSRWLPKSSPSPSWLPRSSPSRSLPKSSRSRWLPKSSRSRWLPSRAGAGGCRSRAGAGRCRGRA